MHSKSNYYHSTKFFPVFMLEKVFYIVFNDLKIAVSKINDIPEVLQPGWLNYLFYSSKRLVFSINIKPISTDKLVRVLDLKKKNLISNIQNNIRRQIFDSEPEDILNQTEIFKKSLSKGREIAFNVSMNLLNNHKDTPEIKKELSYSGINSNTDYLNQSNGLLELIGIKKPASSQIIDLTSLSYGLTFNDESIYHPKNGILYGRNCLNNSLIILDRFALHNHNGIIIGTSGSGKSFSAKLEILRSITIGKKVIIIDPEGEYQKLCLSVGGELHKVSIENPLPINLKSIESYQDFISTLRILFGVLVPSFTDSEIGEIDRCLTDQILEDKRFDIDRFYNSLGNSKIGKDIQIKLYRFVIGSCKNILRLDDIQTTNSSNLIVFNIQNISHEFKDIYIITILNFIWLQVLNNKDELMIFVDEAWILIKNQFISNTIDSLIKRIRKYKGSITFITQDVVDFLSNSSGNSILTNSSYKLFLRQEVAGVDLLKNKFNFNEMEVEYLLRANKGEGIMMIENHRFPCIIDKLSYEDKYIG